MSISITYNNINVFSGQPIPFVGRIKENISYGERWGSLEKISLIGQLTGCDYSGIVEAQTRLVSGFSTDFKTLKIIQSNTDINMFENVFVESINFQSSNYVKLLPYQIELSYYPQNSFSGIYGIVDPSDQWELSQNDEGIIEITHKVSARGIQTASGFNALENAKNFVLARTGFSGYISPQFIANARASGVLKTQVENINRFEATYSITETFLSDQFYTDYGILRYTVDYEKNQNGFNSASIKGEFEGGINDNFSLIKSRASGFDYYSSLLYTIDSGIKLNPIPLTKQITENQNARKIEFSLSYDDNPNYEVNYDYVVGINSGEDLISVSVDGQINGRGDLANRWERVKDYYQSFNPYAIALQEFNVYVNNVGVELDSNPVSESVTYDPFNGTIGFNFSYQDKSPSPNEDLLSFDYSLSITPPIRKITAIPLIEKANNVIYSKYEVTDVGFDKRGIMSINGEAVPKRDISTLQALEATKDAIRAAFITFSSGFQNINLDRYSLTASNTQSINFSMEWSFESTGAITSSNYSQINSL
jgi:hypothetical protein